ncbi:hypothetical protein FRC17_007184 [Serendipita sp. 399]|nr:hypothetical protein FRC17_007184 [Serendipita sp. 399]
MTSQGIAYIPPRKVVQGKGRAEVHVFGDNAHFSELSYTYPLKLLSPRQTTAARDAAAQRVAILYNLTYGGGLIGGDRVELSLDVKPDAKLVLLTQGSTKIFPSRPTPRLSSGRLEATEGAYQPGGSLLLLDWLTSGRMSRGEEWQFDRYRSVNEVWIGTTQVACDVLLLDQATEQNKATPSTGGGSVDNDAHDNLSGQTNRQSRKLHRSLAPYACYATVLMYGPCTRAISNHLRGQYDQITQLQRRTPPEPLIWSYSPLEGSSFSSVSTDAFDGCIVRVAGTETEAVRRWLREALRGLESQIGKDAYSKAFV